MAETTPSLSEGQLAAQAIASWIVASLSDGDFSRQGLPACDVETFLSALAASPEAQGAEFSIALVGFGLDAAALRAAAERSGLKGLRGIADDLHTATTWRNDRHAHPRIIALARGYNPNVHGLDHFSTASAKELALHLLAWAERQPGFTSTPEHRKLLAELKSSKKLEGLRSLDGVARFLSAWTRVKGPSNDAPREVLPSLGLLGDPALFEADDLAGRLEFNLTLRQRVTMLPPKDLRMRFSRASKFASPKRRELVLGALEALDAYRADSTRPFSVQQASDVIKPPAIEQDEIVPEADDEIVEHDDETPRTDGFAETADALLEGNDDDLKSIGDALDEAWADLENGHLSATAKTTKGELSIDIAIDQAVLGWVDAFCSADRFGGMFETTVPDLSHALARHADMDPIFIDEAKIWTRQGVSYSMEDLLAGWDETPQVRELHGKNFVTIWRAFKMHRAALAMFIHQMVVHPREWLDTHPAARTSCERYLDAASELFGGLSQFYHAVKDDSADWAQATLDAMLSLDVVQVAITDGGRRTAKAVMLPLHPLHLWRYHRLGSLLRGFAKQHALSDKDRVALLDDISRPEHFLSVIRASSTPQGRGLNRLLPLSKDIDKLATFENLLNAVSSADGVRTFMLALDRYVLLHPNHPRPLRVAIVNPPEPGKMLTEVIKLLDERRFNRTRLPAIEINVFGTKGHRDRIVATSTLRGGAHDLVYEKVASGRLDLRIDQRPWDSLDELITKGFEGRSFHVVAIFDETSITVRRRRVEQTLRMSPLCVRNDIKVDRRLGDIQLVPHPGEPPFSDFVKLINEVESEQTDSAPFASAEATKLQAAIDRLVSGDAPVARWVFVADRALPEEAGMSAVRLLHLREGQRRVLLTAANHGRLASLMQASFGICNLTITKDGLEEILAQGVNLIGAGLLDMVRKNDGELDRAKVIGFVGMMIAARDMLDENADALVASVDSHVARLWLRLGSRGAGRCDLISIRTAKDGAFEIVCTEVKTTTDPEFADPAGIEAQAIEQVETTATVVQSAMFPMPDDIFAPPRLEMLKEVLVRSASTRWSTVEQDLQRRKVWGPRLETILNDDVARRPEVRIRGEVVLVRLRSNDKPSERTVGERAIPLAVKVITEPRAEALIAMRAADVGGSSSAPTPPSGPAPDDLRQKETPTRRDRPAAVAPTTGAISKTNTVGTTRTPLTDGRDALLSKTSSPPVTPQAAAGGSAVATTVAPTLAQPAPWPPELNRIGMIGQIEPVRELANAALKARSWDERYPDKLLVGPAGVGKSTIAQRISEQFLALRPIIFNGADLKRSQMIVERLIAERAVPEDPEGHIVVGPCLVFIDEVHAIGASVMTSLLGAMDSQRVTTIDNVVYDFGAVVFLLATTDPGRLSEAFLSRPTRTILSPYTLEEVAGIVWYHARQRLGADLDREACIEIAARMQCSPRPSVNILDDLISNMLAEVAEKTGSVPSKAQVAARLDVSAISNWFDRKGFDSNGLTNQHRKVLEVLIARGSASEQELSRTLGITNRGDFIEVTEFLTRLGLLTVGPGGRTLTGDGRRYARSGPFDLRSRISRKGT